MSHKWCSIAAVTAFTVLSPVFMSPVHADAGKPVDPDPTNKELAQRLFAIQKKSRGTVEVSSIGTTNQNRPVLSASVGDGPLRLLYITQQHGDEPLGTPAALEFLEDLGTSRDRADADVLNRLTIDVVVRANPDGDALDQRYNHDPEADPEYGEAGIGYDINRYHAPSMAPEDNPVPEAAAIRSHYETIDPALVVDYHMQGRYADDEGREITGSLMWPTHPDVDADALELSRQATVVSAAAMGESFDDANVSRYPGGEYEGIARNGYGLLGGGSVLVELSAMGPDRHQDQIASAYASMDATARAAADGSLSAVDPDRADDLPERGDPIPSEETRAFTEHGDDLD